MRGVVMFLVYASTLVAVLFGIQTAFVARKLYPGVTKMQRRSFALLVGLIALVVCLPYALLVYPTEWRYFDYGGRLPMRQHRWTGEMQRLTKQGWIDTDGQ